MALNIRTFQFFIRINLPHVQVSRMSEMEKVATGAESSEEEGQIVDEDEDGGAPPRNSSKNNK